jgi:hypothetical protein
VAHDGDGEGGQLRQDRLVRTQAVGRAEPGQVDRHRAAIAAAEAVEQRAPGVGTVGEAVQQDQRRTGPLELERSRLESGQLQPVLEQRLHRARSVGARPATWRSSRRA